MSPGNQFENQDENAIAYPQVSTILERKPLDSALGKEESRQLMMAARTDETECDNFQY
jgi:hypothetical protein